MLFFSKDNDTQGPIHQGRPTAQQPTQGTENRDHVTVGQIKKGLKDIRRLSNNLFGHVANRQQEENNNGPSEAPKPR